MKTFILFLTAASCSVTLTVAVSPIFRALAANEVDNNTNLFRKTPEELTSIFRSSIIYWDLDESTYVPEPVKLEMKQKIMKKLVDMPTESTKCECPRDSGTMVCDSTRKLHSNICAFQCDFSTISSGDLIKPMMILTETPPKASKKKCEEPHNVLNRERGGDTIPLVDF